MSIRRACCTAAWASLFLFGIAKGDTKKTDTPKRVAAALKKGFSNGHEIGLAFERAVALKGKFPDKQMQSVVKALGRAFKQDNKAYQLRALDILGILHVDNSYAQFGKLLKLPKKVVGPETRAVRLRAIATAGVLHDPAALGNLGKLLAHPDVSFARASVRAHAGYKGLEKKKKLKLVRKLVLYAKVLERESRSRESLVSKRARTLTRHVHRTLEMLTGIKGPESAADWETELAKPPK